MRVLVAGRVEVADPLDLQPLLLELQRRGHDVTVLAGLAQRAVAEQAGAAFRSLTAPSFPSPSRRRGGPVSELRERVRRLLIEPLPDQWSAVQRALSEVEPDVVIADALSFAACLLAELPRESRPPVLILGTIPPPHANPEAAPYGLGMRPDPSLLNRIRNRVLHVTVRHVLMRPVLVELQDTFRHLTGLQMAPDTYSAAAKAEVWAQCGPERFEYPLSATRNLRLVGPLTADTRTLLPTWWSDADPRSIVQLRLSFADDPARLLPALLRAFPEPRLHLVLTGITRAAAEFATGEPLPVHVDVWEHVPAGQVLPGTVAVITRGQFVHVQHALQQGVPVITYGDGLEEIETGARVAWSGCGIPHRSALPTGPMLRAALQQIQDDPAYRQAAVRFAAQAARTAAESTIADLAGTLVRPTTRGRG